MACPIRRMRLPTAWADRWNWPLESIRLARSKLDIADSHIENSVRHDGAANAE